jgi:hypothetical protein
MQSSLSATVAGELKGVPLAVNQLLIPEYEDVYE